MIIEPIFSLALGRKCQTIPLNILDGYCSAKRVLDVELPWVTMQPTVITGKEKNNNRKIKYNLRQQQHYCKSFWMFLKLWEWLNTVIIPMLTVRDLRAQNNKQTRIHVLWTWYLGFFFSQPPVPLFSCQTLHRWNNLWRQEGLYYTRHDKSS